MSDPNRIITAGLKFVCRVCGTGTVAYVRAVNDDGRPRPPRPDERRLATVVCEDCAEPRVHVRADTLSDHARPDYSPHSEGSDE